MSADSTPRGPTSEQLRTRALAASGPRPGDFLASLARKRWPGITGPEANRVAQEVLAHWDPERRP